MLIDIVHVCIRTKYTPRRYSVICRVFPGGGQRKGAVVYCGVVYCVVLCGGGVANGTFGRKYDRMTG